MHPRAALHAAATAATTHVGAAIPTTSLLGTIPVGQTALALSRAKRSSLTTRSPPRRVQQQPTPSSTIPSTSSTTSSSSSSRPGSARREPPNPRYTSAPSMLSPPRARPPPIPNLTPKELVFHSFEVSERDHGKAIATLVAQRFNLSPSQTRLSFLTGLVFVSPSSRSNDIQVLLRQGLRPCTNPRTTATALSTIHVARRKAATEPELMSIEERETFTTRVHNLVTKLNANVLYRDHAIVVLNKWAGLCSHGGKGIGTLHLANTDLLKLMSAPKGTKLDDTDTLSKIEKYPVPVHRLDKPTTGCLLMGVTSSSRLRLARMMAPKTAELKNISFRVPQFDGKRQQNVESVPYLTSIPEFVNVAEKRYIAFVSPSLPLTPIDPKTGERDWLVMDSEMVAVESPRHGFAQRCLRNWNLHLSRDMRTDHSTRGTTMYQVLASNKHGSILRLVPLTGRRHQIRAQCAQVLGSPIVGDTRYANTAHATALKRMIPAFNTTDQQFKEPLMLHLHTLILHDWYGPSAHLKTVAPLPSTFRSLIESSGLSVPEL